MPPLRAVLTDVVPIERRNMNLWEDEAAKAAVVATERSAVRSIAWLGVSVAS